MSDKELASQLKIKEIRDRIEKLKRLSDDYAVETRQALEEELSVLEGAVPSSSTQQPVGNEQIKEENPKTEAVETNSHQVKSDDLPNPPEELKVEKTTLLTPSLYGGRFTRKQYFLYLLVGFIIFSILESPGMIIGGQWGLFLISIPAAFLFFVPIAIKRAHDIGLKGSFVITSYIILFIVDFLDIGIVRSDGNSDEHFWLAFYLIILIPAIIYGSFLLFKDSDKGTNIYGPSAKYPSETLSAPLTEQSENIDKKQKLRKWEICGNIAQLMSLFVMTGVYFYFPFTLHLAVQDNNTKIAELMIKMGSDVNKANSMGFTPLMKAVFSSNTEIVKLLIDNGADIQNDYYLHRADTAEIAKLLINAGADVNKKIDGHGMTPLASAVSGNNIEVAKLLIEAGAGIHGQGLLGAAVENEYNSLINYAGAEEHNKAFYDEKIALIKLLIHSGVNVNERDKSGYTPLRRMLVHCRDKDMKIVKLLLDAGVNLSNEEDHVLYELKYEAEQQGETELLKQIEQEITKREITKKNRW